MYTRKSRFFLFMHYFVNKVPNINYEDIYKAKFFLTCDHLLCSEHFFIEIIYLNKYNLIVYKKLQHCINRR